MLYGLADYFNDWPGSSPQPIYITTTALVGISYLAAGVVAWHRRPSERTGLLFMIVAVTWYLPALTNLRSPVPFLVGNLVGSLYQASLAYLALAWPSGHLHSRTLRVVVVVVFVSNVAENFASTLFWNPRTNGCSAGCPANLILVDGSNRVHNDIDTVVGIVATLTTVVVVDADCPEVALGARLLEAGDDTPRLGRRYRWRPTSPSPVWSRTSTWTSRTWPCLGSLRSY